SEKSARSLSRSDSLRTVANTFHPARLIRATEDHPIPLDAPVITTLFCGVGINPQGAKTVDTSSDEVNGREVSELRQTKKPGPISGPGSVLAGCPDKSRSPGVEFQVSSLERSPRECSVMKLET